jgi:aminopeptidase N
MPSPHPRPRAQEVDSMSTHRPQVSRVPIVTTTARARRSVTRALAPLVLGLIVMGFGAGPLAGAAPLAAGSHPAPPSSPLLRASVDDTRDIKPWDYDVPAYEAPLKAAYYRDLTRWNQTPTANELAMDAIYYDLSLVLTPSAQQLSGHLHARLRVDTASVSAVDLDLAPPLTVTAVTCAGLPAGYVHANEVLTITLNRLYRRDEIVEVTVDYRGTPSATYGAFGFDTHNGSPMIWSLSEPFGARSWWPCDDWSDDKADSVDMRVTLPSGLIVASNGELREVTSSGGLDTYWWHAGYPISTYLVSIAAHPYTVYSDYYRYAPDDSMEIKFFIFPDDYASTLDANMMTADMVARYAGLFGEYPFLNEKYGHAEFPWGGAMEHQTCTSMGVFFESIIAHELSHQWWGDMVTCADFHHVWLNEGFATYAEALWYEGQYGAEAYRAAMNATRFYGPGTIYVPALDDWGRIFDGNLSYNKGGWVLHMLRGVLGDADFFTTLAAYRAAFEYGNATTEDFRDVAEAVSGKDLTDFFQQWIYGEYYPQYAYAWRAVPVRDGYELQLTIDQTQTTGLFHMPIQVRVQLPGGDSETLVVDNALAHEEYALAISGAPEGVDLDPDGWILKTVQEAVTDPTFDAGILLVNGLDWANTGADPVAAYAARAFWGNLPISFWDCFDAPAGGYPATLPAPLGHGRVPANELGRFDTVIWVGNDYNGDLTCWMETGILSYLQAGGNVVLLARHGEAFLGTALRDYLGVSFVAASTIANCTAVHPLLTTIARLGTQNQCQLFSQTLQQPTSEILYVDTSYNPDYGVGVWRAPAEGGTHNPGGGRFAFVSGRPYRWAYADLAANVETIVTTIFPSNQAVADDPASTAFALRVASPALAEAGIAFTLAHAGQATLDLYDAQGRRVRRLVAGPCAAGSTRTVWDGRDERDRLQPAGMYYARLATEGRTRTAPLLLLR